MSAASDAAEPVTLEQAVRDRQATEYGDRPPDAEGVMAGVLATQTGHGSPVVVARRLLAALDANNLAVSNRAWLTDQIREVDRLNRTINELVAEVTAEVEERRKLVKLAKVVAESCTNAFMGNRPAGDIVGVGPLRRHLGLDPTPPEPRRLARFTGGPLDGMELEAVDFPDPLTGKRPAWPMAFTVGTDGAKLTDAPPWLPGIGEVAAMPVTVWTYTLESESGSSDGTTSARYRAERFVGTVTPR